MITTGNNGYGWRSIAAAITKRQRPHGLGATKRGLQRGKTNIEGDTNERRAQKEEQHKHPPANRLFADVD